MCKCRRCQWCQRKPHHEGTFDRRGPYSGLCCFFPAKATSCDPDYAGGCTSFGSPFEPDNWCHSSAASCAKCGAFRYCPKLLDPPPAHPPPALAVLAASATATSAALATACQVLLRPSRGCRCGQLREALVHVRAGQPARRASRVRALCVPRLRLLCSGRRPCGQPGGRRPGEQPASSRTPQSRTPQSRTPQSRPKESQRTAREGTSYAAEGLAAEGRDAEGLVAEGRDAEGHAAEGLPQGRELAHGASWLVLDAPPVGLSVRGWQRLLSARRCRVPARDGMES